MQPRFFVSIRTFTVLLVSSCVVAMLLFGAVIAAVVELDKPHGEIFLYAFIAADFVAVLTVLFVRVCCDTKSDASDWGDAVMGSE